MYKTKFEFNEYTVKAICKDVDDYNVYAVNVTFEPELETIPDALWNDLKERIHEELLEAKTNKDAYEEMTEYETLD